MSDEIYLDKIRLGALIVEKELLLIEQYNKLISDIRLRSDLIKIIKDYPDYNLVWRSLAELYDFLENDYSSKLSKTEKDKIKKTMESYRSLKEVSLIELGEGVKIVRKIMSLSKFHDLIRKSESTGLDKINNRYKLNNEN